MAAKTVGKFSEDLKQLLVPLKDLTLLPGNSNKGDVEAVKKSFERFGQRSTITIRRDEDGKTIVLAGNTRVKAARELGWTHIAASYSDDMEQSEAVGFAVTDNHTARMAEIDAEKLRDQMEQLVEFPDILEATSYDDDFVNSLLNDEILPEFTSEPVESFTEERPSTFDDEDEDDDDEDKEPPVRIAPQPTIQYQLVFDDEEQQQLWYAFIRHLRREDKVNETIGSRVVAFVKKNCPELEE